MRSTYHYVVPLHFCFILSKFFAFKFQSRKREVVINLCEDTEKFMQPANPKQRIVNLRVILILNEVELFLDPLTSLGDIAHLESGASRGSLQTRINW